jgi:hypothetical protein
MRPEIERQIENFSGSAGDRVDPVAQALRRLYQRVMLCPCQFQPRWKEEGCYQCQFDKQSIEAAWLASDFISVKEKLPENAQRVLLAEYDPNYSSAAISGEYFDDAGFVYVDAREGMRRGVDVRYWMPSPEIPKE